MDWKNELDASIFQSDISQLKNIEFGKSVEYIFDRNNVPFAMRIEKVKEFNG